MALSLTLAAAAFAPPRSHLTVRRTRCALTMQENREPPHNVLGGDLDCCCVDVRGTGIGTGFYRDGFCSTGDDDRGRQFYVACVLRRRGRHLADEPTQNRGRDRQHHGRDHHHHGRDHHLHGRAKEIRDTQRKYINNKQTRETNKGKHEHNK